ncbi:MAG: alpha-glucosidase [Clostridia bacterium]|nr:alpha-glucosidase [Clostridia bacterium]
MDKNRKDWWKEAVIYQIYPKSFQDTNGDGFGDLPGIIEHLDYLQNLGVDAIWLSPIYASPQKDNGYDISDYQAIDPRFGTMEDFERLVSEADKRGISIIMDLVLNHTSDQHKWFQEARKSKDNPYHDYYVWRDGEEGTPPNEMQAVFGGPAWTYVPELGQYYFNIFSPYQPDLNWDNPKVRQELYDMIRFWKDKGVGGFRLDVIDMVGKEPDKQIASNGSRLHEYIQELSSEVFQDGNLVTVGETPGVTVETARKFSNPDGSEFSMVFQFEHMGIDQEDDKEKWDLKPLDLRELKQIMARWQEGLEGTGWNSLYLDNHDQPRIVSRWGNDGQYRTESAKMLATMLYGMKGTPYIYQGEELGMTNIELPIDQYDDLEIRNVYEERLKSGYSEDQVMESIYAKGRDNARTPMQWTDGTNAGFTDGTPWLPVNPNYVEINAEAEVADPASVYNYYKKLIALRREYKVFETGTFRLVEPYSEELFAYTRDSDKDGHLLVVCNFSDHHQDMPRIELFEGQEVLISNYEDPIGRLRPYEARIVYVPAD